MIKFLQEAANVLPSRKQLDWYEMESYAFIHFGPNTYTNKEWGNGTEAPSLFNPVKLDCDQWVSTIKAAGMKGMVLTAKHHDGFCLWPSKYTEHSVKNSPLKRDVVKEAADACRRGGIKFGFYLSPWDRNSAYYGTPEYNDYFCNQLTELLTQYGDIFYVWFDNACGEGPNGKKQVYDFPRYFELIHKYQPEALIFNDFGPDIRWCGNEAGQVRPSEWSVVAADMTDPAITAQLSQQEDNEEFRNRPLDETQADLGSRECLRNEEKLAYYPAETDVSIRPGWFYHEEEDDQVRSFENLKEIYLSSVGGNTTLLLNLPPMKNGKLHQTDVNNVKMLGDFIRSTFKDNLVDIASITTAPEQDAEGKNADLLRVDDYENVFRNKAGDRELTIHLQWTEKKKLSYLVLKEADRKSVV